MTERVSNDRLSRRALLGNLVAGAAGATTLSGCTLLERDGPADSPTPTTPTGTPDGQVPHADRFETVVDVVEAGADAGGEAVIDTIVEEHADDDTLLYFPAGRYRIRKLRLTDFRNLGLVSEPGATPTVVPAAPAAEVGNEFLQFVGVTDLLVEGFAFDFRTEGYGGLIQVSSVGDFEFRDVRTVGKYPADASAFRFDVADREGKGLVENVVARGGSGDGSTSVGIYVGRQHAGELTFRNCTVENFPNNGLYASSPGRIIDGVEGGNGPVHVEGGLYRNNNVANIRLGTTGATARDVTIVVDQVPPATPTGLNARGLRLRARSDQVIENCEITIGPEAAWSLGGIVIHGENGRAIVRNTRIRVDRDNIPAVNTLAPTGLVTEPSGAIFENVRIDGVANGGTALSVVNRDGTQFRNGSVHQPGANRHGFSFRSSDDCVVEGSTIAVTGEPIHRIDSQVETLNVVIGEP